LAWSDKSVVVAPWVIPIVALDRNVVVAIGGSFLLVAPYCYSNGHVIARKHLFAV
jgi:hypothetical protein